MKDRKLSIGIFYIYTCIYIHIYIFLINQNSSLYYIHTHFHSTSHHKWTTITYGISGFQMNKAFAQNKWDGRVGVAKKIWRNNDIKN